MNQCHKPPFNGCPPHNPCPPPIPPCSPSPCPPPPVLPSANCPPCAPIPPVHIPACGDTSVWPAISALNQRVNECIGQTNSVISNARQVMACIEQAACENGAYYGPNEINLEEGYDAANSSKYYVIRIKPNAMDGTPIRMQLKLAYDNTTNSRLQQNAFEASMAEYAQIMVPAVPVDQNLGWFGLAVWNDAPIQSSQLTNAYTAGFTKSGRFKWYANTVDMSQLKRDQIENAMGVYGILVAGGDITDASLRAQIPNANQRMARVCIGQNYDTRETFILTCGNTDTNGMTSQACAAIMKQYGCDAAVECCQGPTSCALDKGQMLYVPDNHEVPAAYAYWYVTKKCSYRTQFVRELAELTQKYGQAIWAANLTYGSVSDVIDDIQTLTTQYGQLHTDVEALKAQSGQSSHIVTQLQQTVTLLDGRVTTLEEKVAQFAADSGSIAAQFQIINNEITSLKEKLNTEIADRTASFQQIQNNINSEITNRQNQDTIIRGLIDDLSATVTQYKNVCDTATTELQNDLNALERNHDKDISDLQNDITTDVNNIQSILTTHTNNISSLRADLTALTTKTQEDYDTLNGLISTNTGDIGNLKTQVASLLQSMTSLDEAVSNYTIELADIENTLSGIKEVNVTILAQQQDLLDKYNSLPSDLSEFAGRITAVEQSQKEIVPKMESLENAQNSLNENVQTLQTKVTTLEECCTSVRENIQEIRNLVTTNQNEITKIWDELQMAVVEGIITRAIYIDPELGNDANTGTTESPVRSLDGAIIRATKSYNSHGFSFFIKENTTAELNTTNTLLGSVISFLSYTTGEQTPQPASIQLNHPLQIKSGNTQFTNINIKNTNDEMRLTVAGNVIFHNCTVNHIQCDFVSLISQSTINHFYLFGISVVYANSTISGFHPSSKGFLHHDTTSTVSGAPSTVFIPS